MAATELTVRRVKRRTARGDDVAAFAGDTIASSFVQPAGAGHHTKYCLENGGSGEIAQAVACPSTSQCTAVDNQGQQVTFNPTAPGVPTPTSIDAGNALQGLACPSSSQCTAVENEGHEVTFNPDAPSNPAIVRVSGDSIEAIACPSFSECVGVGNPTNNVVTFDPASPEDPNVYGLDPNNGLGAVACPSISQCTAVDLLGQQVTFDPEAPGEATPSAIDTSGLPQGSACPSTSQCTVVDSGGREVTFDPQSPGAPTTATVDADHWLSDVTCPTSAQCTAVGESTAVTFDPTNPGGKVRANAIGVSGSVEAIACPSASQCTAMGADEEVTFNPTEEPSRTESPSPWEGGATPPGTTRPVRTCIAPGKQLGVRLSSGPIKRPTGKNLELAGVTFRLDNGARHIYRTVDPNRTGVIVAVTVTTFPAHTSTNHPPVEIRQLDTRLSPGVYTLTMKFSYKKMRDVHGHYSVSTNTYALRTRFSIC